MQPMRHGDLILVYAAPIDAADRQFERYLTERQVLPHLTLKANTGHCYRIANGQAELYQEDGSLYLQVFSEAQLMQEGRGSIKVAPGIWLVWMRQNDRFDKSPPMNQHEPN